MRFVARPVDSSYEALYESQSLALPWPEAAMEASRGSSSGKTAFAAFSRQSYVDARLGSAATPNCATNPGRTR